MKETYDVIVIGAGAAGLMCAMEAGFRGRKVLVLDHANKAGKKILMSGGGRCNFTNYDVQAHHYVSQNPHFCKSALKRYTPDDFIQMVRRHRIPFHEKTAGQLFCDESASQIVRMLLTECESANVTIRLQTPIRGVMANGTGFDIQGDAGRMQCQSLVIATGGLSIPTMGASPFGYHIATQFGLSVHPTRAGLVPFTLQPDDKARLGVLSGIAVPCEAQVREQSFSSDMLFTHRGLSGPAMLQLSSYWHPGDTVVINYDPKQAWALDIMDRKRQAPRTRLKSCFLDALPKRVTQVLFSSEELDQELHQFTDVALQEVIDRITQWRIKPNGTEGYRTAEVTLGGVDTTALSSKTMAATAVPGLYFVGEVVDVSGWLGGYNFQWAWSSGWAAGQVV